MHATMLPLPSVLVVAFLPADNDKECAPQCPQAQVGNVIPQDATYLHIACQSIADTWYSHCATPPSCYPRSVRNKILFKGAGRQCSMTHSRFLPVVLDPQIRIFKGYSLEGIWIYLECIFDIHLQPFSVLCGHEICCKYVTLLSHLLFQSDEPSRKVILSSCEGIRTVCAKKCKLRRQQVETIASYSESGGGFIVGTSTSRTPWPSIMF